MIGQTISHYKILQKLGEGGMGVVYKAQDTKLDRFVALKFLPPHLAASEQDKARFIQEAKAASALNHPNVCTIHDIQEHEGQMFIVMEYVDGQELREKANSVSFKQAVDIGIQIADGLAAAHEKGIVHRDIKPENIMIRKDGIVQIMDFGLAKLRGVSRLTKEGSTVGTASYMSPEQVQGLDTDHRSDIFSLGVLLHELFTGHLPFKGMHETAVTYEIVNVDAPPMSSVKSEINPSLDAIVLECLEKDPNERTQSARQVSIDLKRFKRESSRQRMSRVSPASRVSEAARKEEVFDEPPTFFRRAAAMLEVPIVGWSVAFVFFLLAAALAIHKSGSMAEVPSIHANILSPEKRSLNPSYGGGNFSLSMDGTKLAFTVIDTTGKANLWIRPLNSLSATMLPGTEGAYQPFWAPDNHSIGFFAKAKLKRIDASGGPPIVIADAVQPRGGSWNESGIIIYAPDQYGPLYQVPAAGGSPRPLTHLDSTIDQRTHRWPHFLPDGEHFLYFGRSGASGHRAGIDSVYVASLDGKTKRTLFASQSGVQYSAGYLIFMREATILAQQFDIKSLEVSGESFPVANQAEFDIRFSKAVFTASQNGILVYQEHRGESSTELILQDRSTKKINSFGHQEIYYAASLSKDGRRIAEDVLDLQSRNIDIWIFETGRGLRSRLTFDPAIDRRPVWSPDATAIIFSTLRGKNYQLYSVNSAGSGSEHLLFQSDLDKDAQDLSSDGKYLLFVTSGDPKTKSDLWVLPLFGDRKPVPFVQTEFDEFEGRFSPDMHWIAYTSDESGSNEVYVRPFPGQGGRKQVSSNGGSQPRWRRDGKELFFLSENKLMAAEIRGTVSTFDVLDTRTAFDMQAMGQVGFLDLSFDGQKILCTAEPGQVQATRLVLVANWIANLKKK